MRTSTCHMARNGWSGDRTQPKRRAGVSDLPNAKEPGQALLTHDPKFRRSREGLYSKRLPCPRCSSRGDNRSRARGKEACITDEKNDARAIDLRIGHRGARVTFLAAGSLVLDALELREELFVTRIGPQRPQIAIGLHHRQRDLVVPYRSA